MADDAIEPQAVRKKAPTLYAIIVSKLLKGLSFAALAAFLYALSDNDLNAEYQKLLDKINHTPLVHAFIHVNPEKKFWVDVSRRVDALTEKEMVHASLGTLIYGLFALVEAVGLMFRWPWAGWLSIGESAFFIPLEVAELMRSFHWMIFLILVFNIFIVWYLFQNRARLFKAHASHG